MEIIELKVSMGVVQPFIEIFNFFCLIINFFSKTDSIQYGTISNTYYCIIAIKTKSILPNRLTISIYYHVNFKDNQNLQFKCVSFKELPKPMLSKIPKRS